VAFKAPTYNRSDLPRYNDKDQTPPSTSPKKEEPDMEWGGEPRDLPVPERMHSNRGRRQVSFYDVGGLLGERRESTGSDSGATTVVESGEGGQMMLNDVGGLLGGQR
jgi:hypothetical protein